VIINGENFHALETLLYAYEGKVDCIYIDPPYNKGAKDWKYNNDFVDSEDAYRHSKWLAFIERRLRLAKRLLNPENSVLIVTIDETEYLRLGLLLEQIFTNAQIQMISSVINPSGAKRAGLFSRSDEYIFMVVLGAETVQYFAEGGDPKEKRWWYLRRTDLSSRRGTKKGGVRQFYPIYVSPLTNRIVHIGEALAPGVDRSSVPRVEGAVPVFPVREDGIEMNWGLTAPSLQRLYDYGFVRVSPGHDYQPYIFKYLSEETVEKVESGELSVIGSREDGSKIVVSDEGKIIRPTTAWSVSSHDAGQYGTSLLGALIPGRRFPFPKSLYAVEDALRYFIGKKPSALIVDFFSGSGTTAHAVMRLNHHDGGQRRCICITNNEVSAGEQEIFLKQMLRPSDDEWKALGICDYITKPRITAAITGKTPEGNDIKGDYLFTDEFSMVEGFEENAIFYNLTYQDELSVELDRAFAEIAPLLWMRAGSQGRCISERKADFDIAKNYGILFDYHAANAFLSALSNSAGVKIAYIVTNQDSRFQDIAQKLPEGIKSIRLYESYIRSFKINQGEA